MRRYVQLSLMRLLWGKPTKAASPMPSTPPSNVIAVEIRGKQARV